MAELRSGEYGGSDSDTTIGTVQATSRQPTVMDYSQSNQFKLFMPIFPMVEWFVVRCNIPSVTLGQADQYTPFVDIALVGDKLQYGDFNMTFIVDEQLQNYMEMYNWVKNIGFPFSGEGQFNKLDRPDGQDRGANSAIRRSNSDTYVERNDRDLYTDIIVTILSSKNNAVAEIQLYECFPVSLGSIEYNQQETDTTYATCDVSFAFTWYDVIPAKSTATV
jgi:hypothetical protein|tara:strand:+ start:10 stop:669 length:660 start_codon:yes stop_codon:yes gene_type:complete